MEQKQNNYDTRRVSRIGSKITRRSAYETTWGKPARDIITGIGNNGGIRPVRAIWELVQNARDVVCDGKRAKIVFTRNDNSLDFIHDGIPFTPAKDFRILYLSDNQ